MQHAKLQIGCMIVLLYIAFIYFREIKKNKMKHSDSFFDEMLVLGIVTLFFDGLTAYMVNSPKWIDTMVNLICHAAFLICLDCTIFMLFMYMLYTTGLYPKRKLTKAVMITPFLINVILVLVNINSLEYRRGVVTNYSMGVSVYTCFLIGAVYTILSIAVFIKRWNYMESHKRVSILTYLIVLAVVSAIQMTFPETLISSIGVTVFYLGVYLNLEDPSIRRLSTYHSEMVMAFATLIENRDNSTGGHIKRTSQYVELIAKALRKKKKFSSILTSDYIANLKKAAPMHDIGKVAVPDAILQKPGKLTPEEFEVMKTHSAKGGEIIEETFKSLGDEDFMKMAYEVARHHHEKWSGKGYPDGLKENEIPLCARIMAVADVFDAVSEHRCYRPAMPLDKCFEIISEGRGQDFDPEVADVFLSMRKEVEAVHAELNKKN